MKTRRQGLGGVVAGEPRKRHCRNLRLICLLFDPLRQFLVSRRDCAHHLAGVRVAHGLGFCQNFLGARSQVSGKCEKLMIRHFARPPTATHTLSGTLSRVGAIRLATVTFSAVVRHPTALSKLFWEVASATKIAICDMGLRALSTMLSTTQRRGATAPADDRQSGISVTSAIFDGMCS